MEYQTSPLCPLCPSAMRLCPDCAAAYWKALQKLGRRRPGKCVIPMQLESTIRKAPPPGPTRRLTVQRVEGCCLTIGMDTGAW